VVPGNRRFGFEFVNQPGLGFQRRMHGEMGEIEEEGLLFVTANEVQTFVGQKIGQISAGGVFGGRIGFEIEMPSRRAEGLVKTAFGGMVLGGFAEVPFAEHAGDVASRLQGLGKGHLVQGQAGLIVHRPQGAALPVKSVNASHRIDAGSGRVLTAQQRGARGGAIGAASVTGGQPQPLGGQPVNVRRLVIPAAVTGQVGVTQVIGQNENNVGPGGGGGGTRQV